MAHGPDTEELLRRIREATKLLDVFGLNITSLPELPAGLQHLFCGNTQITSLPDLPAGLQHLFCSNTPLTSLPELPAGLQCLSCCNTPLTSLSELPAGLQVLHCGNTRLTSLPELPAGLQQLYCGNTPFLLTRNDGESIADYNLRLRAWREEQVSKSRSLERCKAITQDLITECFHPDRVEKWLEIGGHELLDMMFGDD